MQIDNTEIGIQEVVTGTYVYASLKKCGGAFVGYLQAQGEVIDDKDIRKFYHLLFGNDLEIDVYEDELRCLCNVQMEIRKE